MPPKKAAKITAEEGSFSSALVKIEYCKSWGAFKTRAEKLQKALQNENVKVVLNEEKPRKGAFVVTIAEPVPAIVLELLNLQRPFPKLKALDIDEVFADTIKALDKLS